MDESGRRCKSSFIDSKPPFADQLHLSFRMWHSFHRGSEGSRSGRLRSSPPGNYHADRSPKFVSLPRGTIGHVTDP